jgi:hypothetical protein
VVAVAFAWNGRKMSAQAGMIEAYVATRSGHGGDFQNSSKPREF